MNKPDTDAIGLAIEALEQARAQFNWYAELHAAKPDIEKARRNSKMADTMLDALDALEKLQSQPAPDQSLPQPAEKENA